LCARTIITICKQGFVNPKKPESSSLLKPHSHSVFLVWKIWFLLYVVQNRGQNKLWVKRVRKQDCKTTRSSIDLWALFCNWIDHAQILRSFCFWQLDHATDFETSFCNLMDLCTDFESVFHNWVGLCTKFFFREQNRMFCLLSSGLVTLRSRLTTKLTC
jgi:hypothetical protein